MGVGERVRSSTSPFRQAPFFLRDRQQLAESPECIRRIGSTSGGHPVSRTIIGREHQRLQSLPLRARTRMMSAGMAPFAVECGFAPRRMTPLRGGVTLGLGRQRESRHAAGGVATPINQVAPELWKDRLGHRRSSADRDEAPRECDFGVEGGRAAAMNGCCRWILRDRHVERWWRQMSPVSRVIALTAMWLPPSMQRYAILRSLSRIPIR